MKVILFRPFNGWLESWRTGSYTRSFSCYSPLQRHAAGIVLNFKTRFYDLVKWNSSGNMATEICCSSRQQLMLSSGRFSCFGTCFLHANSSLLSASLLLSVRVADIYTSAGVHQLKFVLYYYIGCRIYQQHHILFNNIVITIIWSKKYFSLYRVLRKVYTAIHFWL